jgi:hypothetical protein
MNATMTTSAVAVALRTFPNKFPISIGLFISQEIELLAVVLHHLHGHYEPLQYDMGCQAFHIAVTPIYFLESLRFSGCSPIRRMNAV